MLLCPMFVCLGFVLSSVYLSRVCYSTGALFLKGIKNGNLWGHGQNIVVGTLSPRLIRCRVSRVFVPYPPKYVLE